MLDISAQKLKSLSIRTMELLNRELLTNGGARFWSVDQVLSALLKSDGKILAWFFAKLNL